MSLFFSNYRLQYTYSLKYYTDIMIFKLVGRSVISKIIHGTFFTFSILIAIYIIVIVRKVNTTI